MLSRHSATHYLCAHTYIIKNITMKLRKQIKILARSVAKQQLFCLLFSCPCCLIKLSQVNQVSQVN